MHTIFLTRGIQQQVDLWKMFMQTQMFPFRQKPILKDAQGNLLKNPDGTYQYGPEIIKMVQGSLRPIQIWEYVHPKESYPEVLAMLGAINPDAACNPNQRPLAWVLRKAMGLKPVEFPEIFKGKKIEEFAVRYTPREGVAISVVGIKDDITKDFLFGNENYYQEGL